MVRLSSVVVTAGAWIPTRLSLHLRMKSRDAELTVLAALLPLIVQGTPIQVSTNGYSAFCSPNNALAFALNLPDDGSNDLYFSLSAWSNISWAVRTPTLPRWSTLTVLGCGQRKPRYIEP